MMSELLLCAEPLPTKDRRADVTAVEVRFVFMQRLVALESVH